MPRKKSLTFRIDLILPSTICKAIRCNSFNDRYCIPLLVPQHDEQNVDLFCFMKK